MTETSFPVIVLHQSMVAVEPLRTSGDMEENHTQESLGV